MSVATDLLMELLACDSPSGREGPVARLLARRMADLGLDATIDAVGNVIGEGGDPDGPRVLLVGHLDTVPGGPAPRRAADVLVGRGAVDAKGPLAALTLAAAAAARGDVRAHLVVAGVVEEETAGSRGAHHLLETQPRPDALVVGEPNGWDGIGIGYKGRTGIALDVNRPRAHTSAPAPRATEAAVAFWLGVRDHLEALGGRARDPGDFARPVAALTGLTGDIGRARAEITCRVPPDFDFDAFERHLDGLGGGDAVTIDERTPAVRRDRSDPVVRALVGAIRRAGARPRLKLKGGTCDLNVLAPAWDGVPAAVYGPGDSTLDHTDHEHVYVADLERGVTVLTDALAALARVPGEATTLPDAIAT